MQRHWYWPGYLTCQAPPPRRPAAPASRKPQAAAAAGPDGPHGTANSLTQINAPAPTDLHQGHGTPKPYHWRLRLRKGQATMTGYDMNNGGIWMVVMGVVAVLAIAALVKYLRK